MTQEVRGLYLDLLKRCLTNSIYAEQSEPEFDAESRSMGFDFPDVAHTMIGMKRLDSLQQCIEQVIKDDVPGDLVETGVWRGGATIFMRGVLKAYGVTDRQVWVVDSFEGLPPPDPEVFPEDAGDDLHTWTYWVVSLDTVRENFRRYDLLDDQVRFLKGWFRNTLPTAPIKQIAVLRLDGDMYESTFIALDSLYSKVPPGGYVIVDDYFAFPGCQLAVDRFRENHGIQEEIHGIDWHAVYWRRA